VLVVWLVIYNIDRERREGGEGGKEDREMCFRFSRYDRIWMSETKVTVKMFR